MLAAMKPVKPKRWCFMIVFMTMKMRPLFDSCNPLNPFSSGNRCPSSRRSLARWALALAFCAQLILPFIALGQGVAPPNNSWYDGGNIANTGRSGSWSTTPDGYGNTCYYHYIHFTDCTTQAGEISWHQAFTSAGRGVVHADALYPSS